MTEDKRDVEFLGDESLDQLTPKELALFIEIWETFLEFLRTEGKNPKRNVGYAESNVRPLARRVHQVHSHFWDQGRKILTLSSEHADEFVETLNDDQILNRSGEPYSEGSKRKFTQALEAHLRFQGVDWDPPITFSDNPGKSIGSAPFTKFEREKLFETSLNYLSPPSYSNVSPSERDRWNIYLAQLLGKPKDNIGPDDWESLQHNWKIPSLISTGLDIGPRAELVKRLSVDCVRVESGEIHIPADIAVKNDRSWTNQLSARSVTVLEKWLAQRKNISKYDNSDHIWLNRKGNPYNSATLNDLLAGLIEEAELNPDGRKLTWHSIRHSTGMYVYDETQDLEAVAEILRHATLESARKYAHPTPESQKEVVESLQGGDHL